MVRKKPKPKTQVRRTFTKQFKQDAVQMLLDGHSASSVSANLGLNNTNLLYRWKAELIDQHKWTCIVIPSRRKRPGLRAQNQFQEHRLRPG